MKFSIRLQVREDLHSTLSLWSATRLRRRIRLGYNQAVSDERSLTSNSIMIVLSGECHYCNRSNSMAEFVR